MVFQRANLLGQGTYGFRIDGDAESYLVSGPVVANLQVEGVVQLALCLFRQGHRIDGALRQQIEERRISVTSIVVPVVEFGQAAVRRAAFCGDLCEPALQRRAPFGVDVVVAGGLVALQLSHEIGLGSAKLIELFAKGRSLRGDAAVIIAGLRLSMVEVQGTLRSEDALAEERADRRK